MTMQADDNRAGTSRRSVLKIFALAGAAGLLGLSPLALRGRGWEPIRQSRALLGTVVNLTVYSSDREQAQTAVVATLDRMAQLEGELSRFRPASQVGMLNAAGSLDAAGTDLLAVLELARQVSEKSGGAFDVTMLPLLTFYQTAAAQAGGVIGSGSDTEASILPRSEHGVQSNVSGHGVPQVSASGPAMRASAREPGRSPQDAVPRDRVAMVEVAAARELVDYRRLQVVGRQVSLDRPGMGISLDGIGKGYIVDAGLATLQAHGCGQVYVEAGGDLVVGGGKPSGEAWRIGIAPPRPGLNRELTVVSGRQMAVATSGDYLQKFSPDYRHHHIIDPRTGFSPPQLAGATVIAPTAALADALATAVMVLGLPDAFDLLAQFPETSGRLVTKELAVHQSPGFAA